MNNHRFGGNVHIFISNISLNCVESKELVENKIKMSINYVIIAQKLLTMDRGGG